MRAHEVCQGKVAFRTADKQRTSLFKPGDMLTGKIVVRHEAVAIRGAFQCFAV